MKLFFFAVVLLMCSPAFSQEIQSYPYTPPQKCVWRYGPVDKLVEVTLIDACGHIRHEYYWRRVMKWYKCCKPEHNLHILGGADHERSSMDVSSSRYQPIEQRDSAVSRKRRK